MGVEAKRLVLIVDEDRRKVNSLLASSELSTGSPSDWHRPTEHRTTTLLLLPLRPPRGDGILVVRRR